MKQESSPHHTLKTHSGHNKRARAWIPDPLLGVRAAVLGTYQKKAQQCQGAHAQKKARGEPNEDDDADDLISCHKHLREQFDALSKIDIAIQRRHLV
jgi:hypothetical protein